MSRALCHLYAIIMVGTIKYIRRFDISYNIILTYDCSLGQRKTNGFRECVLQKTPGDRKRTMTVWKR